MKKKVKTGVILWVAYPKGTSGVKTDINRDSIAGYASGIGLQPVAMFAIDETWAALRLKIKEFAGRAKRSALPGILSSALQEKDRNDQHPGHHDTR